jgi:hypothetical protein
MADIIEETDGRIINTAKKVERFFRFDEGENGQSDELLSLACGEKGRIERSGNGAQ